VRELKNVVERFIVRGRGDVILPQDLPSVQPAARTAVVVPPPPVPGASSARPAPGSVSADLLDRMVNRGESFWSAVYEPFMTRDLTRADVRTVVTAGLQQTRGSYKMLVEFFNMAPQDYKRFLNVLRKHQCHMPFQQFRTSEMMRAEPESLAIM
jgi:hypothetical protein